MRKQEKFDIKLFNERGILYKDMLDEDNDLPVRYLTTKTLKRSQFKKIS